MTYIFDIMEYSGFGILYTRIISLESGLSQYGLRSGVGKKTET
jgi:hypothetical protein